MAKQKPGTVAPPGGERSPGSGNEGDFVTVAKVIKTQGRIGEVAAVFAHGLPTSGSLSRARITLWTKRTGGGRSNWKITGSTKARSF